jgi:formate dehydrogenase major subunit
VQACPTGSLAEKALYEIGVPEHSKITTCAYCGVGCAFKAEMRGEEVVRMMPWKDGKANRGHSCVKGRFAYGYATHPDRILTPMVREKITDPWRETTWEEAIGRVASEFRRIQAEHGKGAVGGITSSRCTNEETFLVQKLIRQGFGVNNVDTCARVCHSPTGYGLKATFGESAGTQDFDSVEAADVMFVIGANPTDGAGGSLSGGLGRAHRRRSGAGAGGGAALCDRRERRDLLRARSDRAQPGVDDGDGDREPRDGDR